MTTARELKTELVVLGSGPGGYSAAFRAADLGKRVILIERDLNLGGVCLNVGCIPSKVLLHAAELLEETALFKSRGIDFGIPKIDIAKLRDWKNSIVRRLTIGLKSLAKQRKVEVINGTGTLVSANQIDVKTTQEITSVNFENIIIAAGSSPIMLPFLPQNDPRIMYSTEALALETIPNQLLVIGGGIIGLEMATVYQALGSQVTIVELMDQLIPGADPDIVKPLHQQITKKGCQILLKTKVTNVAASAEDVLVTFENKHSPNLTQRFDRILVSVGRKANGKLINAESAGVMINEIGIIPVDNQMRTNVPNIFAIGDIVGNPMLAHKSIAEGRLAAEVICGKAHTFTAKCIPCVAYTNPAVATVGLTETVAKQRNIAYEKGVFPWLANGRSLSLGSQEGFTKILFDPSTKKIIGAGIVGPQAGELITELALAIELEATADDLAHTIHPHPTLSETTAAAAEVFNRTVTDLYLSKPV